MRPLRILLDCDGVLADLIGELLVRINKRFGTHFRPSDVDDWDVDKSLGISRGVVYDILREPGFVSSLRPLPGAPAAVEVMQADGHQVYVATSPSNSNTWMRERENWIISNLRGFDRDHIIQCAHKFVIKGDVLVDDKPENVIQWAEAFPEGMGVLWTVPHDLPAKLPSNALRCDSWSKLQSLIRMRFPSTDEQIKKAFAQAREIG